jgi:hypothetical protein
MVYLIKRSSACRTVIVASAGRRRVHLLTDMEFALHSDRTTRVLQSSGMPDTLKI